MRKTDGQADEENPHVAWRIAVARRVAGCYAGNAGVAALAVAGSVGAGLADQFSDLELDCYWHQPPSDEERLAPVRALGGELTALWDYDEDDEEWSEDYRVGELDITVSNFLTGSIERFVDDVVVRLSTEPVRHMRLAALQRSCPLIGAVVTAVLALNRVYLPHRQLKWQTDLVNGLRIAPDRLSERLASLSAARPEEAIRTAEALLGEVADLAEAHSSADLGGFREGLSDRRRPVDPPAR